MQNNVYKVSLCLDSNEIHTKEGEMPNKLGWTIKLCQSKINPHIQRDTIDYEIHCKKCYIFLGQSPSTTIGDHHSFCQSVNHSIPQGYNRFFCPNLNKQYGFAQIFFYPAICFM